MSEFDSALFHVDINNYNGPLDVLLDLAKAQKVDLEEISIRYQFLIFVSKVPVILLVTDLFLKIKIQSLKWEIYV